MEAAEIARLRGHRGLDLGARRRARRQARGRRPGAEQARGAALPRLPGAPAGGARRRDPHRRRGDAGGGGGGGAGRGRRGHRRRAVDPADPGHRRRARARRPGLPARVGAGRRGRAKVAIVGGSATGCEAAELLADQGRARHDPRDARQRRARHRGDHAPAPAARAQAGGRRRSSPSAKVVAFEPDQVLYEDADGATHAVDSDLVGLAIGWKPRGSALADAADRASRCACWATRRGPRTSSPRSTRAPTQDWPYDDDAQGRPSRPGGQPRPLSVPRAPARGGPGALLRAAPRVAGDPLRRRRRGVRRQAAVLGSRAAAAERDVARAARERRAGDGDDRRVDGHERPADAHAPAQAHDEGLPPAQVRRDGGPASARSSTATSTTSSPVRRDRPRGKGSRSRCRRR